MGEAFEDRLRGVSLLDIYDDIAAINLTPEQLIQSCTEMPCSVNLKTGNLVYSVEQKYKDKLAKYRKSKRLKWLQLNLKAIIPHPEEKLLKWQSRHEENKKYEWIQRKLHVLDHFVNETLIIQSEEPCCSHSLFLAAKRRKSQQSRRSSYRDVDTSYSTAGNTSSESMQTVIQSQQKSIGETDIEDSLPLINFKHVSRSTLSSSSGELPSLVVDDAVISQGAEAISTLSKYKHDTEKTVPVHRRPLQEESEGPLSEEAYVTFYQDMQVTSTQEFG